MTCPPELATRVPRRSREEVPAKPMADERKAEQKRDAYAADAAVPTGGVPRSLGVGADGAGLPDPELLALGLRCVCGPPG